MANVVETHAIKQLTTSNVIDEYQKEAILWNLKLNASRGGKGTRLASFVPVIWRIGRYLFCLCYYSTNVKMYSLRLFCFLAYFS